MNKIAESSGITVISIMIIILVVVVIILIFFSGALKGITDGIGKEINKFLGIKDENEEEYESNFDKVVDNIKDCKSSSKANCLCDIFPNFPGTFKHQLYLVSQGTNMELSLKIGTTKYFSEVVENYYIASLVVEEQISFGQPSVYEKDYYPEKWIDFSKDPPRFDNKAPGDMPVASSSMYKGSDGTLYLLLSETNPRRVESNVLDALNIDTC